MEHLFQSALNLLKQLIATPSFSKEEDKTATIIYNFLKDNGIDCNRLANNLWAKNLYYDDTKPTILLNSHHDTVKPNIGYTLDPFMPLEQDGKLYGLGSNDAGGALVGLIATFLYFYNKDNLKYNLVLAATAEEEITGTGGIEMVLPYLGKIDCAVVGEPTNMHPAVAEKGLLVVDATVIGEAGHAARDLGVNAIYLALEDIKWIRNYRFEPISQHLGPVKMTVTIIQAGAQHNVIPDRCSYTIDIRTTDAWMPEQVMGVLKQNLKAELTPRSFRLRPSFIESTHPLVQAAVANGRTPFGSPTCSDQGLIPVPSMKIGPGFSERSHTANEYITLAELKEGIELYIKIISAVVL